MKEETANVAMPAPVWGRRILVLGDTDFYRVLLSYLLESKGLRVTVARTAEEAIAKMEQELYGFDVFILNLCLPGLDHIKVFEHFKQAGPKIRFRVYAIKRVFTSPEEEQDLRAFGLSDFLDKSLSPEEIIFRLGEHLFSGLLERRKTIRIPVFLPADYRVAEHRFSAYITDLSSEGLFLQVLEAEGSWVDLAIDLSFRLPGSPILHAIKGKIRHSKPGVGLGINFFQIPKDHQKAVDEFVRAYLF